MDQLLRLSNDLNAVRRGRIGRRIARRAYGKAALAQYAADREALASLAQRMAFAQILAVLPSARRVRVHGSFNEDWLRVLRVVRIEDGDGRVLFDAEVGHDDSAVEAAVDEANSEYLDLLMDLTGDEFLGSGRRSSWPCRGWTRISAWPTGRLCGSC